MGAQHFHGNIDPRVRALLRETRGWRLNVLFVLWASSTPLTVRQIAGELLINRDTVSDHLQQLYYLGYVAPVGAGRHPLWTTTDKAQQLPLPGLLLGAGKEAGTGFDAEKFRITPTATAIDLLDQGGEAAAGASDAEKPRINPDLADAFRAAGIGSNMWTELARLAHITPDYIRQHDEYRRARGESVGLLITRLRAGDAVPTRKHEDVADAWARALKRPKPGSRKGRK